MRQHNPLEFYVSNAHSLRGPGAFLIDVKHTQVKRLLFTDVDDENLGELPRRLLDLNFITVKLHVDRTTVC